MDISLFARIISQQLKLPQDSVRAVLLLFESGATVPFIARYRKEATGSLDEVQILDIHTEHKKLKDLVQRKEYVLKSIESQEKLSPELKSKIEQCWSTIDLEDIYLPYKQKRKTRAEIARKNGLEPLAKVLLSQRVDFPERDAQRFIRGSISTIEQAYDGARDIIAEWISENAQSRNTIRKIFLRQAMLHSRLVRKHKEAAIKYKDYFEFEAPLYKCPSHRILAIRRAEKEGFLRVSIIIDEDHAIEKLQHQFINADNESSDQVKLAIADGFKRLLLPSIENEFKKSSKDKADDQAIEVFSNNVTQLLLAPPAGTKVTMGIDPGFRTGCKLVVLNETGQLVFNQTIYPHPPQNKREDAKNTVQHLINKFGIGLVAVGNGTAGRETLSLVKSAISDKDGVEAFSVNEAGASIYSASPIAREEFPDLDLTVRGAISIARRLMDPLAELVKIDPKSIGVGQYQHDVNQDKLQESLDNVVTLAVNNVGVNLNSSSKHLLQYVSGIGPKLAQNIIDYRKTIDKFSSRNELKKVKGLGAKAFEQAAGFLRIPDSKNILDKTAVHPESYVLVKQMAKQIGHPLDQIVQNNDLIKKIQLQDLVTDKVGLPTLQDITKELNKPGLDPRGAAVNFSFDDHITSIDDLSEGIELTGIVSNLTKFGAFVDIGIKENGLIHISQIVDRYISDPSEALHLEQKVRVKVLSVDKERKRIQLSMKGINQSIS